MCADHCQLTLLPGLKTPAKFDLTKLNLRPLSSSRQKVTIKKTEKDKIKNLDFGSELIIGLSDGMIIPFAILAGMSSAGAEQRTAIFTCIAAMTIGAVAMGRGGYRAGVASSTATQDAEAEIQKTRVFLANLGLNEEMQDKAIDDLQKDREEWNAFITKHDLETPRFSRRDVIRSAFTVALSYFIGGLIPLAPFLFLASVKDAFQVAIPMTIAGLAILGFVKGRVLYLNPLETAFRLAIIGASAAAAAFFTARLFT
jgi:VIT1/CCC1 family predicted Fe2+/Mn2+ transporter